MEEVLRSSHLNAKQVLRVFYATCSAVAHMHSQQPPIVHRDLKVSSHSVMSFIRRLSSSQRTSTSLLTSEKAHKGHNGWS